MNEFGIPMGPQVGIVGQEGKPIQETPAVKLAIKIRKGLFEEGDWDDALDALTELLAAVETLERQNRELQRRIRYLLTTEPAEWEPEVIRWLSASAAGREEPSAPNATQLADLAAIEALKRIAEKARWYHENPKRLAHEVDHALCVEVLSDAEDALTLSASAAEREEPGG